MVNTTSSPHSIVRDSGFSVSLRMTGASNEFTVTATSVLSEDVQQVVSPKSYP